MVGLFLYQGLQVVFVVQDLLEVLAHGCNYSFIVFVALLEGFILLPDRFKFLLDLIELCVEARELVIQIVDLCLGFVVRHDNALKCIVLGL